MKEKIKFSVTVIGLLIIRTDRRRFLPAVNQARDRMCQV